jgi:hypothetical protein
VNRLSLIAAAVVGLGVLSSSATARADTAEFLTYLGSNGEDVSSAEVREAQINLGLAICNLYATSLNNRAVMQTMMDNGQSTHEIAVWTVGSVMYLCPQYNDLLP